MAEKQKTILEFKNVFLNYHTLKEETPAIKNLSFKVYDKEFLTVVGPSGCGKSSVLSLIAGMTSCSRGKVIADSLNNSKNKAVGYMFQKDYLFDWRTVEQNVVLGLEIQKNLTPKSREYAVLLLQKYGLGEFLNYYPSQLSGGMRQKAALIRTLALKPEILLLDEPFSALDYQARITISEEIRGIIKSEGKTAVLVSHDISEAVSLSDRIIILSSRPATVKKTIKIDFGSKNLSTHQKHNHPKFNEYFDAVWEEMINETN